MKPINFLSLALVSTLLIAGCTPGLPSHVNEILACVDDGKYMDEIVAEKDFGAENFGITGTPANILYDKKSDTWINVSGSHESPIFMALLGAMEAGENVESWLAITYPDQERPFNIGTGVSALMNTEFPAFMEGDDRFLIAEYFEFGCIHCANHWKRGTLDTVQDTYSGSTVAIAHMDFPVRSDKSGTANAQTYACAEEILGKEAAEQFKAEVFTSLIDGVMPHGAYVKKILKDLPTSQ